MKLFATAVIAASLSALSIAPVSAAEPLVITVDAHDLDMNTPAGAERLANRIQARVSQACERPFIRDLKQMQSYQNCVDSARDVTDERLALTETRSAA